MCLLDKLSYDYDLKVSCIYLCKESQYICSISTFINYYVLSLRQKTSMTVFILGKF